MGPSSRLPNSWLATCCLGSTGSLLLGGAQAAGCQTAGVGNLLFGVHWIPFFWVGRKQQVAKQLVDNLLFGVHWVPFFEWGPGLHEA